MILIVPELDPALHAACLAAQRKVDSLVWMDDEPVLRTGAEAECALFRAAGFIPHFDRDRSIWPTHDDDGNAIVAGELMTTVYSEHQLHHPSGHACGWYRLGGHYHVPEIRATFRFHERYRHNVWADVGIEWAPETDPVLDPPVPLCAVCEQNAAEYRRRLADVPVELCVNCNREFERARLLLGAEGFLFGAEMSARVRASFGDSLRAELVQLMESLREIVAKRRRGDVGDVPALGRAIPPLITQEGSEDRRPSPPASHR